MKIRPGIFIFSYFLGLFVIGALPPRGNWKAPQNREEWKSSREELKRAMQEVMGPLPAKSKKVPLQLVVLKEEDCGSFLRQKIEYSSEPETRVPAYLLIPKSAVGKKQIASAVLCLHQTHVLGNKVVVGLGNSPDDEYGVELVKLGFVCLAPNYPLLADYQPKLQSLGYASGSMKAIWDNICGLDLLESLPFVRPGNFGVIGHSLGGHNGIFTAVFDDRIKVVVSSCGFDSFFDYMNGDIRGWTSDRYMPRLLQYSPDRYPFDFPQILSALAPRAVFVNAPVGDSNFKHSSVARVVSEARTSYELFQAGDRLQVRHPDAGHGFPPKLREEAYDVIKKTIGD